PGNVRELKNVIERAISLVEPGAPLGPKLLGLRPRAHGGAPEIGGAFASYREAKERVLCEWERAFIRDLLLRSHGNVARAARVGGLDRVYLHRLMKKHGISAGREH